MATFPGEGEFAFRQHQINFARVPAAAAGAGAWFSGGHGPEKIVTKGR
jgi:hypothetical protein